MSAIKVAVLGAGKMGGAIVRRLHAQGFEVSIWDRTRKKAEALGVARVVDSPAAAARAADVVLSILTGPQAVREVYFGKGGVLEGAAGKTLIEMSTAGPRSGLDPARIFWVLSRAAPGLKVREAGFVEHVHEPTLFAARDLLKDLDLGLALYGATRVPLTWLTRDLFAKLAAKAPGLDISAITEVYRRDPRS